MMKVGQAWRYPCVLGLALLMSGCAVIGASPPDNRPIPRQQPRAWVEPAGDGGGEVAVAMSFSGGGMRAAAFALGALQGLQEGHLLEQVRFITSVSGGSLTAAWVGLNGIDSLPELRRTALLHAKEGRASSEMLNSVHMLRIVNGGLRGWMDDEVFHGATFSRMGQAGRPAVWINATDLYQRLPFTFNARSFEALCSDLSAYSVAEAVAASMAVPLVFSPVVLEKHPDHCDGRLPHWLDSSGLAAGGSMLSKAALDAMRDYRDFGNGRYVKLADGGLTDNFGLSSILQARLLEGTPLAPLDEAQAMRLRHLLFVVVDGGRRAEVAWGRSVDGPSGLDMAFAAIDAAIDSNKRQSYDHFLGMSQRWRDDIARWRCARPANEQRVQTARDPGWRCDDVHVAVARVSFDDLAPDRARQLHAVSTRLMLPEQDVDTVIEAGRDAMVGNAIVQEFSRAVRAAR